MDTDLLQRLAKALLRSEFTKIELDFTEKLEKLVDAGLLNAFNAEEKETFLKMIRAFKEFSIASKKHNAEILIENIDLYNRL